MLPSLKKLKTMSLNLLRKRPPLRKMSRTIKLGMNPKKKQMLMMMRASPKIHRKKQMLPVMVQNRIITQMTPRKMKRMKLKT